MLRGVTVVQMGLRSLGLLRHEVDLVESDPLWPEAFRRLAIELERALDSAAIEHVGSTAVPGLRAKPILDVAVGVPPPVEQDRLTVRLAPLGLECRGDQGSDGGILFVLEDRPAYRVAHVHVVAQGSPEWEGYLAFRDRLRRDASACADYAELKQSLARRFPHDRPSYTAGKHAFIAALLVESL